MHQNCSELNCILNNTYTDQNTHINIEIFFICIGFISLFLAVFPCFRYCALCSVICHEKNNSDSDISTVCDSDERSYQSNMV